MRLISARLKGLKGIYSKSGVKEIFIDFNKSIHDLIYIIGQNGSGKTTLLTALQPLPDPPTMFIDGEPGEEELVYDNKGVIYRILIQYPVFANGNRATTKAFISKSTENGPLELNSNGTVGSFKEILFNEFRLDPNFISLSHLSVEDRGLVEKTPKDRKKLVGDLLESIEVYNDIHKTLTKRASSYKAIISSISAKVDSIGDEATLRSNITGAETRLNALQQNKKSLEDQIAMSRAAIKVIDPTGELQEKYKELFNNLNIIKDNINMIESSIPHMENVCSLDDAVSLYTELKEQEMKLKSSIMSIEENIRHSMNIRAEDASVISAKSQKVNALLSEQNTEDLERSLKDYRKKLLECETLFTDIGIDGNQLTTDEFKSGLSIFNTIRDGVTNIRSYASYNEIIFACVTLLENSIDILTQNISSQKKLIEATQHNINSWKEEVRNCDILIDQASILDKRPESCKDDNCPFIKQALEAKESFPALKKADLNKAIDDTEDKLIEHEQKLRELENIWNVVKDLNNLLRYIESNKSILQKFPSGIFYLNTNSFLDRVKEGYAFNDITQLSDLAGKAALFSEYQNIKEVLIKLEAQEQIVQSQKDIIEDIQREIDQLTEKLKDIDGYLGYKRDKMNEFTEELKGISDKLNTVDSIIASYRKLEKLEADKADIESQLKVVSGNIEKISKEVSTINMASSDLLSVVREIEPLSNSLSSMSYSLNQLMEYKQELEIFNTKQTTIELIRKYSSPTKGGIQTVFMQLYMDKTLSMANQILGMMFNNSLEILPYIINENEFRIPIKSNVTNLIVDDVSNCSTSEKSMIGMIMSFVLGFHGSREYNIIRLDEIDGGLDQSNRSVFPTTLYRIMNILDIDQCFIISHSSESDLSNADIISLTPVSNEVPKGNVIFQL